MSAWMFSPAGIDRVVTAIRFVQETERNRELKNAAASVRIALPHLGPAQVRSLGNQIAATARRVLADCPQTLADHAAVLPDDNDQLARDLIALNAEALRQRYGDALSTNVFKHRFTFDAAQGPMQAYKSLNCFIYQCSEGNVPETPFYKAIDAASDILGAMLGFTPRGDTTDPELRARYDAAIWG